MTTQIKLIIVLIALFLLSTLFLMVLSIRSLQDQIDGLYQRNEVLTQQLQEMNKYVQYPGG
ncbi:hypothetical protein [Streptococcus marmotae]|uniref:hypothetical protein n=1 Tax=Streptococcus marmotae TaxID=1825069 RepID=UPI00082A3879|nr:hypothetical protein [Streptococcus marmotae]QBX16907.1 hypothetical protein Javan291_0031 [Streptococcus phage Javan291]